ncbi:MAG TPA: PspC domain-containing protein [Solirubrobacteraceae bacterium]|jgi:phage shock protein PspC (stress-responsive transcriptional regulator)|nr:PspC domain-containing protein [Solirubrobacteraceae bacterium]
MPSVDRSGLPPEATISRARQGRWLAGVCAGVSRHRGVPVVALRVAFAVAALFGGLGMLVYLACWVIIPAEGDVDVSDGPRGVVVLAQALAACAGLATLVALGSAAAVFGFGWAVVALAGLILVVALASWPRVGPAWVLLPIAALALPAVAMAVGGVRLAPRTGLLAVDPVTIADTPRDGYRGGIGDMIIDLRHTSFPASGPVELTIDGGLGRTIVALPAKRCVHVELRYDVVRFLSRFAELVTGNSPYDGVDIFGTLSQPYGDGFVETGQGTPGPTLVIDFHSQGASLYVRDYPNNTDPLIYPYWPGFRVPVETRPNVAGISPRAARRILKAWRRRRAVEVRSARLVDRLLPGPCGAQKAGAR